MTEAAFAAVGGGKRVGWEPIYASVRCYDCLADAFAWVDSEGLGREVDYYYADFASVVGVDSSGGVEQSDAIAQCQTAAWAELHFITGGEFYA